MALDKFRVRKGISVSGSVQKYLDIFPLGSIIPFAGSSVPDGWFLCDGSSKNKADYPDLNLLLSDSGYPFGSATLTFNVPDFRFRSPIGVGAGAGLTARTLGSTGGSQGVVLSSSNLPAHTHGLNSHTHDSSTVETGGSHTHTLNTSTSISISASHTHNRLDHLHSPRTRTLATSGTANLSIFSSGDLRVGGFSLGDTATAVSSDTHGHNDATPTRVTGSNSATHTHNLTTNNSTEVASDGTFNNDRIDTTNPFLGVNFIIKY